MASVPTGKLEKIVISAADAPAADLQRIRNRFPAIDIVSADDDNYRSLLADADAVMSWGLTAKELAAAPHLWWLQAIGAGVDTVLIPELIKRQIVVTNASGAHANNISEHIFAMMLAFTRQLPILLRGQTTRTWTKLSDAHQVGELSGQTMLLVGLGDIGAAVASRAAAFGLQVLAVRRRPNLPIPPGVSRVYGVEHLANVLPLADQVVITLPLTSETKGLFDATMLGRMKQGSYLYNIGRGSIIDSEALIEALERGWLGGAGLDVTDPEPLPSDSPLWDSDRVIITAHTSGRSPYRWKRILDIFEANIAAILGNQPMVNVVDYERGY